MARRKLQTQCDWVLAQLLKGRRLTAKMAMDERGIQQMGARVFELRGMGCYIESTGIKVLNRYGEICHVVEYRLARAQLLRLTHTE